MLRIAAASKCRMRKVEVCNECILSDPDATYAFSFWACFLDRNDLCEPSKFRIKIWDNNNGLVYDNQLGVSDDSEPTTEIKGGSIVIHKENNT